MSSRNGNEAACPRSGSATAYAQKELPPDEGAEFERHLEDCAACRTEVEVTKDLIRRLRECPEDPARDLVPGLLERIPQKVWAKPAPSAQSKVRLLYTLAKAAAVLLAALGVSLLVLHRPAGDRNGRLPEIGPSAEAVTSARTWLASAQEPDGSWAPDKWGGQPNYTVGLTGLAMLSFIADLPPAEGPYTEVARRAAVYLAKSQARDGRLGPRFSGELYNHGIASVALVEYYTLSRDESLKEPVRRALEYIRSNQAASGGWGYSGRRRINTSITVWQLSALLLAGSLELPGVRGSAERGLAWLGTVIDAEGRAGYDGPGKFPEGPERLTAMVAFVLGAAGESPPGGKRARVARSLAIAAAKERRDVDYYRSFFFAYALHAVEGGPAKGREHPAPSGTSRAALVGSQVTEGPYSGSFEPRDHWSLVGGRIYATAMAALSLQADEHAPRMLAMMRGAPR